MLIKNYKGKVPKTYEELEKLLGVGHKTASVVMSQVLDIQHFQLIRIFIDLPRGGV